MIAKLKRKPVIIGLIILSVLAVAVPIVAVSAAGTNPSPTPAIGFPGRNVTTVQGTISTINATDIYITVPTSTTPVHLAIDANTNFNIHGNQWVTSLAGQAVTAVYKNGQIVIPAVASQIMINMPKPPANAPMMPSIKNFTPVQGAVTGSTPTSISMTLTSGAGTLKDGQPVVIIPTPVQGVPNTKFNGVQGAVKGTPTSASITITLTNGAGSLAVGPTVVDIVPGMVPGAPRPGGNPGGGFRGMPQSGPSHPPV